MCFNVDCTVIDNDRQNVPDLSNRTVRQSNPIEHQSFDCRTRSNIRELTIKFCQSNTIERSITERLVIEPNRTFDYRTIGIIERSINVPVNSKTAHSPPPGQSPGV